MGVYDIGEPDINELVIQLKRGRTVVATIHDEDGVLSLNLAQVLRLRDWLNRAIPIMESERTDPADFYATKTGE